MLKNKFFWTIWGIDLAGSLVVLYFFFIGIADGSVSADNAGLWLTILAVIGVVLGFSIPLVRKGKKLAAYALLSVLAIPAVLMAIFLVILLVSDVHWQ